MYLEAFDATIATPALQWRWTSGRLLRHFVYSRLFGLQGIDLSFRYRMLGITES